MLKQNLHDLFTCPLSLNYISDPVMASDGRVYESSHIRKHFQNSSKSPITGLIISTNLISSTYLFNAMVSYYEENNIIFPLTKIEQVTKIKLVKEHYKDLTEIIFKSEKSEIDKVFSDRNIVNFLVTNYDESAGFGLPFSLAIYGKKNDLTNIDILAEGIKKNMFSANIKNSRGVPLISCFTFGNYNHDGPETIKFIKTLIELGADINYVEEDKTRLITNVCSMTRIFGPKEMEEIIDYLIDKGVDIVSPGYNNYTPINIISKIANEKYNSAFLISVIKKLIDKGADVKIPDVSGCTPLHHVCESKLFNESDRLKVIKMMIAAGADINAKSNKGETPLSHYFSRIDKMNTNEKSNYIKMIIDNI